MNDIRTFCEGILVPLILALFGGAARACRFGVRSWRHFCGSIIVSGFAGVVVHLLIVDLAVSDATKAAVVAISGYSGGMMLDLLSSRLKHQVEYYPGFGAGPGPRPGAGPGAGPGYDSDYTGGADYQDNAPARDNAQPAVWDGLERRKNGGNNRD